MTHTNKVSTASINKKSMFTSMAIGGLIALGVILMFVVGAESQPHWPENWQMKPLILTPLAGVVGGGIFYVIQYGCKQAGINTIFAILIGIIAFVVTLWLGIVSGLNGTMWD